MTANDHPGDEAIEDQPDRYEGEEETANTVDEMLSALKKLKDTTASLAVNAAFIIGMVATFGANPAAASHGSLPGDCTIPDGLTGLFTFLHGLSTILFIAGIGVAVIGLSVAAIYFMLPGPEKTQQAKQIVVNVVIGTVLLLSANGVVTWIIRQFGDTICAAG